MSMYSSVEFESISNPHQGSGVSRYGGNGAERAANPDTRRGRQAGRRKLSSPEAEWAERIKHERADARSRQNRNCVAPGVRAEAAAARATIGCRDLRL
jgi:hypothetical protein